ncbi:hypothetical protein BDY24DRAFT_395451 [Mrakia frigida]|uniref:uncharacterized protein n=1 Tax=Mrakia frigida TaxID=29902 RepID=UPI003FCC1CF5
MVCGAADIPVLPFLFPLFFFPFIDSHPSRSQISQRPLPSSSLVRSFHFSLHLTAQLFLQGPLGSCELAGVRWSGKCGR